MRITKIEYIETVVPNMSCGTGYSEPDRFKITSDAGITKKVWIDIWYMTEDSAEKEAKKTIRRNFPGCENLDEAFEMYKDALRGTKSCPYYWNTTKNN